jgi:hypothetical protein
MDLNQTQGKQRKKEKWIGDFGFLFWDVTKSDNRE